MFCRKCGFELPDDAVFCQKCGCAVDENSAAQPSVQSESEASPAPHEPVMPSTPVTSPVPKKKKHRKLTVVLAIISAVVLIFGTLALLILPRPDLTMDDFQDEGFVSVLFRYGVPTAFGTDLDYVSYYDTDITFYGVPVEDLEYNFDDREILLRFEGNDNTEDAAECLIDHCKYQPSLSTMVYDFTYQSLDISAMPLTDEILVVVIEF